LTGHRNCRKNMHLWCGCI